MLRVANLGRQFGGLKVLDDISLEIPLQGVTGLIGPNGAGKTTFFNIVTGLLEASEGRIQFNGQDITGLSAHALSRLGIARTFQNIRLFAAMSVLENVMTAMHGALDYGIGALFLSGRRRVAAERNARARALELLETVGLADRATALATSLPYGAQRRLELARALATKPQLLLLDEPVAGMNPHETSELMRLIRQLQNEDGLAILLIEHDMHFIMNVCDRIAVLNFGRLIAYDTPERVRAMPEVIAAYLGPDSHDAA